MKRKKPRINDLELVAYAAEGKSLGRHEGKVIFVEGAVPGDVVDVQLSKNKKDWGEGKVLSIKKFSSERVEPFCRHFGVCGGCKWQMLPYQQQLQYKQQEALETFRRIGKIEEPPVLPILGAPDIIYYRNKLEFTFSDRRYLNPGELKLLEEDNWPGGALGYHVPRLFDKVLNISECWLMDDVNNRIRNTIREYSIAEGLSFYNIKEHTGLLRNLVIRYASTGELLLNVIFGFDAELERKKLCDFILEKVPAIDTLAYTINPKWNDTIYDLEVHTVYGKGFITEKLGKYLFKISPKSFFQTNSRQASTLYDVVKSFAGLTGKETVYDLYCGTGSIGIYLSDGAKSIIGVDTVEDAIKDAYENAAMNNIEHASFFCGDVIDVCNDDFFNRHGKPDIVIVDPPRAGLHPKLISKIQEIAPGRIIYVSCNVATQARDLASLKENYNITQLQPVDMFPHTHHLECVALLQKITDINNS